MKQRPFKKGCQIAALCLVVLLTIGIYDNLGLQLAKSQLSNSIKSTQISSTKNNMTITFSSPAKRLAPPKELPFQLSPQPVPISPERKALQQRLLSEVNEGPEFNQSKANITGPSNGTQTNANSSNLAGTQSIMKQPTILKSQSIMKQPTISNGATLTSTTPAAPIKLLTNTSLTPSNTVSVLEPAVANKDKFIFYTGNWFSANSIDGGSSWRYVTPFSVMRDYVSDADTIYDPIHKIFIWYMQGIDKNPDRKDPPEVQRAQRDLSVGENHMTIGISRDASNWWFYGLKPTDLNSTWTGYFSDYPYLALGNKYLYISMNMIPPGNFVRPVILRISLDDLANEIGPTISYYNDPKDEVENIFTFTPVQGATDTMYWAVHLSNSRMRIYQWNEASNIVRTFDRDVPAWSFLLRGLGDCPGPDKINWCARGMSKITGGWIANDTVGFLWNAEKGGNSTNGATFSWPYIDAPTFKISDSLKYQSRPYIWSPDFAWMYGFASPDKQGNVSYRSSFWWW